MKTVSLTSTLARVSKPVALTVLVLLLGSAPVMAAGEASAATSEGIGKIAVVDVQFLISNSKAGKSIRNQLEKQRDAYRGQIEKQESDLRNLEKDLVAQQQSLSKEDFLTKRKDFQEKVMTAQRSVQQRRAAFDKAYTNAMEKLRESIVKIVADAAGKNKIALVLNRQEVVLVEEKMDMTKEILKTLDSTVSSIPVTVK